METTTESIATLPATYTDFTGYIFYSGTEAHVKNATFTLVESFTYSTSLCNHAITASTVYGPGIKWYSGTWLDGYWQNGIWHDGTWKKGTWHDGYFKHGVWRNGTVLHGYFTNVLWKNGHFKHGVLTGVWQNGHAYEDASIHAFIYDMALHADTEHYHSIFTHSSGYRRITLDGTDYHAMINAWA